MGKASIIVPAITQWVTEGRALAEAVRDAEYAAADLEKKLTTTREAARARRIELGRFLYDVKGRLKYGEWGTYLEAIEVNRTTAWRHMTEAGHSFQESELKQLGVSPGDIAPQEDIPPPGDDDAPVDVDVSDLGAAEEVEIDRNTWCTPKWITDALGEVDLDPCANERSHVQSITAFHLEDDQDGLELAKTVGHDWRVFINPPYAAGEVIRWITAYAHTRFCFLLKFDPSTKWFAELMSHTGLVLIPKRTRVEFEPPPGVPPEKAAGVQFPHALFFARAGDAPQALLDRCYVWRVESAA